MLPGEADAARDLQALLGALGVAVQGEGAGRGRSQGGIVASLGPAATAASQATAVICSTLMAMSANRCLMAWN